MLYFILFNTKLTPSMAVAYFLISIVVFFVSLSLRELMRGVVAVKLGDKTPKLAGRITFNPFKHLDPMGFMAFILLGIGWAKPMPINPLNFKKYRSGSRVLALTGILTNFLLGLFAALLFLLISSTIGVANTFVYYLLLTLQMFMIVNSCLVMLHVLPLYPEDMFMFIVSFMKKENGFIRFNLKYGYRIVLGLILISLLILKD